MTTKVILVDSKDNPIGEMEKLAAHREAERHRCFSVFVFRPNGDWLLQKRALKKYHSAGLWSNTCCSHPTPGEPLAKAVQNRLQKEMGFTCPLEEVFSFTYRKSFPNGLTENEFDHVFVGTYEGPIRPDPDEVEDWRWISAEELFARIKKQPQDFTYWFKKIYRRVGQTRGQGKAS